MPRPASLGIFSLGPAGPGPKEKAAGDAGSGAGAVGCWEGFAELLGGGVQGTRARRWAVCAGLCAAHTDEPSPWAGTLPEDLTPGVFLLDSHTLGKILKSGTKLLISQLELNAARCAHRKGRPFD